MDEKLQAQNWKLEIPPLMHFSTFEFYCFTAFCMNREQKIGNIHPPDLMFLWTDRSCDMEKCRVHIKCFLGSFTSFSLCRDLSDISGWNKIIIWLCPSLSTEHERLKVSQDCLPLTIQNSLRIECLDVTVACCSFKQALIIKAIHFLGKTLPFKGKRKKNLVEKTYTENLLSH